MPLSNPTNTILDVKRLVESDRRSEIRLNANGGNCILLVCEPMNEGEFISEISKLLPPESYAVIDLSKCLIEFVSNNREEIIQLYDLLQSATHEIFKAPPDEESKDLFKEIIRLIDAAYIVEKIPVLVNTGSLYGTGIHNIHIMEHDSIMKASLPLIILYPATVEPDRILFLGKQPSSKYRCMIVK